MEKLVLLVSCSLWHFGFGKYVNISCSHSCESFQEKLGNPFCSVNGNGNIASEGGEAAPQPTNLRVNPYIHTTNNGNKLIAFDVQWNQRADQATRQMLTGFRLSVTLDSGRPIVQDLYLNKEQISDIFDHTTKQLNMSYRCFGTTDETIIFPDGFYILQISSLPEGKNQAVDKTVKVPDCYTESTTDTVNCKEWNEDYEYDTTSYVTKEVTYSPVIIESRNQVLTGFVIGSLSAFVIITLVILIYIKIFKIKRKASARVLLICNTRHVDLDRSLWRNVERLARTLRLHGAEVASNLWESTRLTGAPAKWIRENVEGSDCVIFVMSSLRGEREILLDVYTSVIRTTKQVLNEGRFRPVVISVHFAPGPGPGGKSPASGLPLKSTTYRLPKMEDQLLAQISRLKRKRAGNVQKLWSSDDSVFTSV